MTPGCAPFRRLMEIEAAGELTRRQFARLDQHRERCAECADLARAADPLRLFRRLAGDRREPEFWTGMNRGLRAALREEGRLSPSESFRLLRPIYRVAAAAVLVLTAGILALVLAPDLQPPLPADVGIGQVLGPTAETLDPTVELIRSPEATVYEMKVFGEGDRVTELVMIFDEGIEL